VSRQLRSDVLFLLAWCAIWAVVLTLVILGVL